MGELKNKKLNDNEKEFNLTPGEYNFIMAMANNRNDAYNKYQSAISSFLAYLAGAQWGYDGSSELKFDFDSEKKTVKVSKV
jgi:hypothetical protein